MALDLIRFRSVLNFLPSLLLSHFVAATSYVQGTCTVLCRVLKSEPEGNKMRRLKKLTNKQTSKYSLSESSLLPLVCRQGYWLSAQLLHITQQVNKTASGLWWWPGRSPSAPLISHCLPVTCRPQDMRVYFADIDTPLLCQRQSGHWI